MKKIEERIIHLIEQINSNGSNILLEQTSHRCSREETETYRFIFNNNPQVKSTFRFGIEDILKSVFPKNYYGKGEYSTGEMPGIYDLEVDGRSVINKLNTHYVGFCILLNDVNRVLKHNNKPIINLIGLTPYEQVSETKKLISVIDEYKTRIFNPDSPTFKNIMSVLGFSHEKGEKNENLAISKMKQKFGDDNVKKIGKLGSSADMVEGVDCEVIDGGKNNTGQIKPYEETTVINGKIIISGVGQSKKYFTDWLIFVNKNGKVLIFKNEGTVLHKGDFVFPKSSLIYTID